MTIIKRPSGPIASQEQRKLIDDLGGPSAVVNIVKQRTGKTITRQAVAHWKNRGIPYRFRAPLVIEAGQRGIGLPANFLGEGPEAALPERPPPVEPAPKSEVPFL